MVEQKTKPQRASYPQFEKRVVNLDEVFGKSIKEYGGYTPREVDMLLKLSLGAIVVSIVVTMIITAAILA